MKIRCGFVSNSSSGSFIFPEGMSEYEVVELIKKVENILTDLTGKPVSSGLTIPDLEWASRSKTGKVRLYTIGDNTCPYKFMMFLEYVIGADYEHYG